MHGQPGVTRYDERMNQTTSRHVDIRSFQPNAYVEGTYAVVNPQLGTTRAGKPFLKCLLRDASGECPARQWTVDERAFELVGSTGFVWIAGHTQVYDGQVQLILEDIRPVEVSEADLQQLLPSTNEDIDTMFAEVCSVLDTIGHPGVKALVGAYLDDESLMRNFRQAPAAANLHHAWIGGLLEHTWQLLRLANAMLPLYPRLNRDLVLAGVFLHDLAKTAELSWERGFNYTTSGNLIGHIVMGSLLLDRKLARVREAGGPDLPQAARLVLHHIILSHHNEPEYGAAKRPSTPEAVFIAMLDNLDARTSMALEATRPVGVEPVEGAGAFTDRIWALDTRLYRQDPLGDSEEQSGA